MPLAANGANSSAFGYSNATGGANSSAFGYDNTTSGMIFLISLVQTFIDAQKVRAMVEKRGEGVGNLMAAFFGAVTPFCSCSSVPLFIGFVQAGIPLGITLTFLITSPLISEVAFVLLIGMFGWKIALLYLISGTTIGMISGLILGRMKLERYVEGFVYDIKPRSGVQMALEEKLTWVDRINRSAESGIESLDHLLAVQQDMEIGGLLAPGNGQMTLASVVAAPA